MIPAKKRFEVLKRDNFRCCYCWKTWKDVTLEVDHVIPRSKWGSDDFNNLITCCRECNMWKWQTELDERNSKFNIKVKDLFDYIKSEFYRIWNMHIKSQEEYTWKRINWTIWVKTMSLMASFLQWRINNRIDDSEKIKYLINDEIRMITEMEEDGKERWYEDAYISSHPTIVEIKDNMSLMDGKIVEFYEWGEFFDELTQDFAGDFIANDCCFDIVYQDDRWNTDDMDKRLNYTISMDINEMWNVPEWILKKYRYRRSTYCSWLGHLV